MKNITKAYFYCAIWSVALFFSTFGLFCKNVLAVFSKEVVSLDDVMALYIFPVVFALAIFLFDTWHELECNNVRLPNKVLPYLVGYLIFTLFPLTINIVWIRWCSLVCAWSFLFLIKKTSIIEGKEIKSN